MDPTKIEKELGWKPKYNFYTGIIQTIKWNLENKVWLDHAESGEYTKWMELYYILREEFINIIMSSNMERESKYDYRSLWIWEYWIRSRN